VPSHFCNVRGYVPNAFSEKNMNTNNVKNVLESLYVKILKRVQTIYQTDKLSLNQYAIYLRKVIDSISEAFILIIFSIFVNFVLFLMMKIAWHSYLVMPAADHFIKAHSDFASEVSILMGKSIIRFPVELTLRVFLLCISVCTACQLLNAADYFFHTKNQSGKYLFSGLPLTIITGWYLQSIYEIENIYLLCTFTALPVFCMFSGCFEITKRLFPKIKTLIKKVNVLIKSLVAKLKHRFPQ